MSVAAGSKYASCRVTLLQAAGREFAESGYKQATVREIVKRAGASLGAVNYHFRDKAGLYQEVLAYAHERTIAQYQAAVVAESDPEHKLFRFVRVALSHRLVEDADEAWAGQVLIAELMSMGAHNRRDLFEQVIAPRQTLLAAIVRALMGENTADEVVKCHTLGIIGQYILYYASPPVVEMSYGRALDATDLDWLSRHITNVALAGMRAEGARPE